MTESSGFQELGERANREELLKGCRVSFQGDEKCSRISDNIVAQCCETTVTNGESYMYFTINKKLVRGI
jgi:hypothetical protein